MEDRTVISRDLDNGTITYRDPDTGQFITEPFPLTLAEEVAGRDDNDDPRADHPMLNRND